MWRWPVHVAVLAGLALLATGQAPAAPGKDAGTAIEKEYGVVGRETDEGRRLNDQLERVTRRITAAIKYDLKSAKLLGGADAAHDKVVNAFALPDGRIYVTLGLARAVRSAADPDAELAFVVGHEAAHVVEKHGVSRQSAAIGAGLAALLIRTVTGSEAVGTVAGVGGAAYVSHFSREDEYEADGGGVRAMQRAGYNLDAAPSMLRRLQSLSGARPNPTLNGWFGTHPLTQTRIQRVQQLIARIRTRAGRTPGGRRSSARQ